MNRTFKTAHCGIPPLMAYINRTKDPRAKSNILLDRDTRELSENV